MDVADELILTKSLIKSEDVNQEDFFSEDNSSQVLNSRDQAESANAGRMRTGTSMVIKEVQLAMKNISQLIDQYEENSGLPMTTPSPNNDDDESKDDVSSDSKEIIFER